MTMNYRAFFIVTCIALIILQGCTHVPNSQNASSVSDDRKTFLPTEPSARHISLHDLRLDWESQKNLLSLLVLRGAKRCFPASVVIATRRQNRILHELLGGLYLDAANDILIQRKDLTVLDNQVTYVNKYDTCTFGEAIQDTTLATSGDHTNNESAVSRITQLMNSDNQFVTNSQKINPKYKRRLRRAAEALGRINRYVLVISGHTDTNGGDAYNQTLSWLRANAVSDFMQGQGIEKENIIVQAFGEEDILFEGDQDETHLVNRRVDIRILSGIHDSEDR